MSYWKFQLLNNKRKPSGAKLTLHLKGESENIEVDVHGRGAWVFPRFKNID